MLKSAARATTFRRRAEPGIDLRYAFKMTSAATTVLWRLFRTGRDHARAVVLPGGPPFTIAFFANDEMERVENYDSMEVVLFRADEVRRSLEADGWAGAEDSRTSAADKRAANGE
jgi:hypothetical protein